MTLLTRRQLILAKEESVYGTDPTPVVGSDAILVRSISATPLESDTLKNWAKVEKALREAGKTDCMFYKRAVAILSGRPDPLK
jgi:hypothetical protein